MNTQSLRTLVALGALTAACAAPLAAGAVPTPHRYTTVPSRVENQRDRIQQGVKSGQLTFAEYMRARASLRSIQQQRMRDLRANDGTLTAAQRAQIRHRLNVNSSRIWFLKHNRVDQPGV
jgi:hypothetical protein